LFRDTQAALALTGSIKYNIKEQSSASELAFISPMR